MYKNIDNEKRCNGYFIDDILSEQEHINVQGVRI